MHIHDILDSIGDFLDSMLRKLAGNNHNYKGKLGNARKYLKRSHKKGNGIRIGEKYLSITQSLKGGLLLIGKTGIGKSTKIFLQNLFSETTVPMSYVVFDMTSELRDTAMPYMEEELRYEEDILNSANAKKSTVEWNPIANLPLDRIHRFSDELVAIEGGDQVRDPVWNNTSSRIIATMIRLLQCIEAIIKTNRYTNLYNVRYLVTLIQANVKVVNTLVACFGDDMLFTDHRALIRNEKKFLNSCLSNTLSILKLWQDENVIKTTSSTTLDMHAYRREKRILWLQASVSSQDYLSGLNSLLLKEWTTQLMEAGIPDPEDHTIAFLVDEAGTIKTKDKQYIPFLTTQLRKYASYMILGFQSFSQCISLYGKEGADILKSNAGSTLYLGSQGLDTATEISRTLGKYSFSNANGHTSHREVLSPQEVMHSTSKDGGILVINGKPPMPLKRIRAWYQNKKYKTWGEKSAPPIQGGIHQMPPLLPIDELIGTTDPEMASENNHKITAQ